MSATTGSSRAKAVLATVGSTLFDELIQVLDGDDFLRTLVRLGFDRITVQFGKGLYEPKVGPRLGGSIMVEAYRFKPSLSDDMARAQLIISHAGAGSIMESLRRKKNLIVVVNKGLMDDHQSELAEQMQRDRHSYACVPGSLAGMILTAVSVSHVPPTPAADCANPLTSHVRPGPARPGREGFFLHQLGLHVASASPATPGWSAAASAASRASSRASSRAAATAEALKETPARRIPALMQSKPLNLASGE